MKMEKISYFLEKYNLEIAPLCLKTKTEDCYEKRRYSSKLLTFYDTNGIKHYVYNRKDYQKKVLKVILDFDNYSKEYPSYRRVVNLKNIIRHYIKKARILSEKSVKDEITFEVLFTSNNNIKSFQYWMDELAYTIIDNSTVNLKELSLDVCVNEKYKKIVPLFENDQIRNNAIPLNNHLDKLDDYELATIGKEYRKEKILPPYDVAVKLEFDDDFFKNNKDYYQYQRKEYAEEFLKSVMNAKIIRY